MVVKVVMVANDEGFNYFNHYNLYNIFN